MVFEQAIVARLETASTIINFVGNRIYWDERVQGDDYPAIVLTNIATPIQKYFEGEVPFQRRRFQCDCYANDKLAAVNMRQAVVDIFNQLATVDNIQMSTAFVNSLVGSRNRPSDRAAVYREMIDFDIWYSEI